MAPLPVGSQNPDAARVLSAAVTHIAGLWQLSNVELGAIIGLSAPAVARLRADRFTLEPGSKPFELAQHLLRLFRSLDSWLGRDEGVGNILADDPQSRPRGATDRPATDREGLVANQ